MTCLLSVRLTLTNLKSLISLTLVSNSQTVLSFQLTCFPLFLYPACLQYRITLKETGEYLFCFDNTFSRMAEKVIILKSYLPYLFWWRQGGGGGWWGWSVLGSTYEEYVQSAYCSVHKYFKVKFIKVILTEMTNCHCILGHVICIKVQTVYMHNLQYYNICVGSGLSLLYNTLVPMCQALHEQAKDRWASRIHIWLLVLWFLFLAVHCIVSRGFMHQTIIPVCYLFVLLLLGRLSFSTSS